MGRYRLDMVSLSGDTGRTNNLRPDPDLPGELRSTLADYRNSGVDCGRMAPIGAFAASREIIFTTFSLSNMAPQTAHLNRTRCRNALPRFVPSDPTVRSQIYDFSQSKADKDGIPELSYQYVFEKRDLVEERMLKGGIRLARRLNQILKK